MTLTSERSACVADRLACKRLTQLVIQMFEMRRNPGSGAFADTVWMNSLLSRELPGGAKQACRDLLSPQWCTWGGSLTSIRQEQCSCASFWLHSVTQTLEADYVLPPELISTVQTSADVNRLQFHARVFPFPTWPLRQGWENCPWRTSCWLTILPCKLLMKINPSQKQYEPCGDLDEEQLAIGSWAVQEVCSCQGCAC